MQVEFNKAAQSLTEAMIPTAQKKAALNRLVKVAYFPKDYISILLYWIVLWLLLTKISLYS
jgi:hypothetical protein